MPRARIWSETRIALFVAAGILALSLASRVEIPMAPVPLTLQSLVVVLIGALGGWRLALVAIGAWLAAGALGLPVLAGGASGLDRFTGPTAGYLFAFPLAGALVGWLVARGWDRTIWRLLGAMLLGHAVCLGLGTGWLATSMGLERALGAGLWPFLPGALVKSAAAALIVRAFRRI